jgi:hypothetical protein
VARGVDAVRNGAAARKIKLRDAIRVADKDLPQAPGVGAWRTEGAAIRLR